MPYARARGRESRMTAGCVNVHHHPLLCAPPPTHTQTRPKRGLFLTDLTFAEEGNPDETADGLINITKFMQISDILNKIQRFQVGKWVGNWVVGCLG